MKHLLSLISLVLLTTILHAQSDAITSYFDKYVDDERFSMVYISPKMFEMVSKIDIEEVDQDIKDIIKELKGLRILSSEHADAPKFYQEAKNKINTNGFETLITARDGGEDVNILVKDQGDIVNELLVLVGGEKEFTLISFVGNIDLKKVGKLAKLLDINGANHLEKIESHD